VTQKDIPRVVLTPEPLDSRVLENAAVRREAGAVNVFLGTVRSPNRGKEVLYLDYEAHEPMALSQMQRLVDEAETRWKGSVVYLHHRLGRVAPGEVSVVVVAGTPHRAASFDACRHVIEGLKRDVPIWKKEVGADGSEWVNSRP